MKQKLFFLSTMLAALCGIFTTCGSPDNPSEKICEFENPLTDLPWLKQKAAELSLQVQQHGNEISIYQCVYGDNETGFLIDGENTEFYNCGGEAICRMSGAAGNKCIEELNIISRKCIHIIEFICAFDNPITDLPWLKKEVDELTSRTQEHGRETSIYQCVYGDNETGFLIGDGDGFFYNCRGEVICSMGGIMGNKCTELNIVSKKRIHKIEFICDFDNPLTDLAWLKRIVDEYTEYSSSVSKRHFSIHQCQYIEENVEKTGFIVSPNCTDCSSNTAMLHACSGRKLCNVQLGSNSGNCEKYNITNKKIIWEINPE